MANEPKNKDNNSFSDAPTPKGTLIQANPFTAPENPKSDFVQGFSASPSGLSGVRTPFLRERDPLCMWCGISLKDGDYLAARGSRDGVMLWWWHKACLEEHRNWALTPGTKPYHALSEAKRLLGLKTSIE